HFVNEMSQFFGYGKAELNKTYKYFNPIRDISLVALTAETIMICTTSKLQELSSLYIRAKNLILADFEMIQGHNLYFGYVNIGVDNLIILGENKILTIPNDSMAFQQTDKSEDIRIKKVIEISASKISGDGVLLLSTEGENRYKREENYEN
nr:hypothetical protein [Pseudobdellovibrionaceae bacterium]